MNRRKFILGSGSILTMTTIAGCTSEIDQQGVTLDDKDKIRPLEISVTVTNTMSSETPPQLDVEITNTGDKPVKVGDARDLFRFTSGSYRTQTLADLSNVEYSTSGWYKTKRTVRTTEFQTLTLEPGESKSQTVYILKTQQDVSRENVSFPVKFNSILMTQTDLQGVNSGERLDWGFTLTEEILLEN